MDGDVQKLPLVKEESLLSKYRIPIQHLEFSYVEQCNNAVELEKILLILRSGQEGFYPDLQKATEERLAVVHPKSKLLQRFRPVLKTKFLKKDELQELTEDLSKWVSDISKSHKELDARKSTANCSDNFVEIRQCKENEPANESNRKEKDKRIASTDYTAWDKYDPDTEILKMDLDEEILKKKALAEQEEMKKSSQKKRKKSVTFNKFATEAEADFVSQREREKGNEYFKAGDYEEALHCYTNSINCKTSVTNLNNRAITNIKLKRFQSALQDCEKALLIEGMNFKALLRKAQALDALQRYEEALECVEMAIKVEPNNCQAQELAAKIRQKIQPENIAGNHRTRMKIIEIE